MQWVETTGRTVEAAKEAALDELGVDESEAEFEVLEEARAGLFGRLRSEARVRARVKPAIPRAKDDRRDRRRRRGGSQTSAESNAAAEPDAPTGGGRGSRETASTSRPVADDARPAGEGTDATESADAARSGPSTRRRRRRGAGSTGGTGEETGGAAPGLEGTDDDQVSTDAGATTPARSERSDTRSRHRRAAASDDEADDTDEGAGMDVALEEQGRIAEEFLNELVREFGLSPRLSIARPDDETVELQLTGSDLGLLIGPKGATLLAIQDLTRTVVHHRTGANNGRIHVDVGGYRQKRTEALIRFAQQVATTVRDSGQRTALEPMSAVDRKVVHDTVSTIEGVSTVSEGEEPRRRVVILPADA